MEIGERETERERGESEDEGDVACGQRLSGTIVCLTIFGLMLVSADR